MAAAFAGGDGVDFVDDHRAGAGEHVPAGVRAEQHIERFGGGHQDMRRAFAHLRTVFLRGVAGAHGGTDRKRRQAHALQLRGDTGQWVLQVDLDIVGQRLERRYIHHQRFIRQLPAVGQALMHQVVQHREERRQGFTGAGGRGDQCRTVLADQRPGLGLGAGHRGERAAEPGADGGVETVQDRVR